MNDEEDVMEPEAPSTTTPAPAEAPTGDTVTLRVVRPEWCTHMNFPQDDGSTLVIDRKGVEMPSAAASALIETAARNGVTIAEVSN